jgi:GTP pyrophosphokinase
MKGAKGEDPFIMNFDWIKLLMEAQQDTDSEEFIKSLRMEMFVEDVFVFTPNGDVINLPAGATPIDFAYKIHSAVGNRMSGATINRRIVPLDYRLKNGDIVRILSNNSNGPSRDWLKIARTSEARNKIKQWFKRERRDENIQQGKSDFEAEMKRSGITWALMNQDDVLPLLLRKMSFASLEDLFNAIGYGGLSALRAVNRIRDELVRMNRLQSDKKTVEKIMHSIKKAPHSTSGVIIDGMENCMIKFARCCAPVPGDGIIGFVTKGYGISVHRNDCPNVATGLTNEREAGRWIQADWASGENDTYPAGLRVSCADREGLTIDVATVVQGAMKLQMTSFSANILENGRSLITLVIMVHDTDELTEVINKIRRIQNVLEVVRYGT